MQVYKLSTKGATSYYLIISWQLGQTKYTDSLPKMRYSTPTSLKITMQYVYLKKRDQK